MTIELINGPKSEGVAAVACSALLGIWLVIICSRPSFRRIRRRFRRVKLLISLKRKYPRLLLENYYLKSKILFLQIIILWELFRISILNHILRPFGLKIVLMPNDKLSDGGK